MKNAKLVRNYYVLPCCLLLLNLCVELVSYKAKQVDDPFVRTGIIMAMVLFGGSVVGFLVAPGIGGVVNSLIGKSPRRRKCWCRDLPLCPGRTGLLAILSGLYFRTRVSPAVRLAQCSQSLIRRRSDRRAKMSATQPLGRKAFITVSRVSRRGPPIRSTQ